MEPYITRWTWRCPDCGLQAAIHSSNLVPTGWDDASTEALTGLRAENARRLLQALETYTNLEGKRLLDIGCAAGWFLTVAREHGLQAVGIEPDTNMAKVAEKSGLEVRNDWFPQALDHGEQFDLVSFNDVFEHLPDPNQALDEVAKCLPTGGHLLLNLPSAQGFLYRVATLLARLGYRGPFERLWQCDFESPHLYYYDHDNLCRLVQAHGFRLLGSTQIDSLAIRGLWARINETGRINPVMAGLIWTAMVTARPATRYVLPNDILVQFYERC